MRALGIGITALALALLLIGLPGCKRAGPAERAGRKIDQAVGKAGQQVDSAVKKIQDEAGGK